MDRSRLTYSGTIMKGKITMSRSGRTGRTSGILTGSSSLWSSSIMSSPVLVSPRLPSLATLRPLDRNHRLAPAPVLQPRDGDGQYAALELGLRLLDLQGEVQRDRPHE